MFNYRISVYRDVDLGNGKVLKSESPAIFNIPADIQQATPETVEMFFSEQPAGKAYQLYLDGPRALKDGDVFVDNRNNKYVMVSYIAYEDEDAEISGVFGYTLAYAYKVKNET